MPESVPLQPNELREGILYIEKFSLAVEAESILRDALRREREIAAQSIALEQSKTQLAERQAEAEKKRGDDLDRIIARLTKKPSFGCKLKRIFLLSGCS